ncbi:hypothetical protein DFP72DRAFT_1143407 [Ephemerocybe angulata]|uniref:Uncharacterized protein n=1 Tax=Ephemerocybe angulata TaxID=980116 RepID=A0A8H6HMC0_9AGAR|nr:hypothetical protein DFP72DRAFT_1143407 [Tulosesus angulatus]
MPVSSRPIPTGSSMAAKSFSAPTTSTTALSLTYILHNTSPEELHTRLLNAVSNRDGGSSAVLALSGDAITDLFETFRELGFNTAHARAAVSDATRRHCVRCHSKYLERDNGNEACRVPHEGFDVPDPENYASGQRAHWVACCSVKLAAGERMENEWCYVGRHTTTPENVVYNASNVVECSEGKGCPGGMVGLEEEEEEWQEGDEPVPIEPELHFCEEEYELEEMVPTQVDFCASYQAHGVVYDDEMAGDEYSDFLDFEGTD